jgi:hypothetical protein
MKNHSYRSISSLVILGFFMLLYTASIPDSCVAPQFTATQCQTLVPPVTRQYTLAVVVTDRITGEPIPDVSVRFIVGYEDAQVNVGHNSCKLQITDKQYFFKTTNTAGIASMTTTTFTLDNQKDQLLFVAEVTNVEYSANQSSAARFYDGDTDVTLTLNLLRRDAL